MRTAFKPVLVGILMLIPALSQAEISKARQDNLGDLSVSCGQITEDGRVQSIAIQVKENGPSHFVILTDGKVNQGSLTSNMTTNSTGSEVVFSFSNSELTDIMLFSSSSEDLQKQGSYLTQALIKVGDFVSKKTVPCHVIAK